MDRAEILAAAVHAAWAAVSLSLGETPVTWAEAPEWRKRALYHTIGFWESWDTLPDDAEFYAVTHLAWTQYHKRNHWSYADVATPYVALPAGQQRKVVAMLRAYAVTRELLAQ